MIPAPASTDINTQSAILVIRVWAIYEHRRSILIFLLLCWAASYGTSIAIAVLRVKVGNLKRHPGPVLDYLSPLCFRRRSGSGLLASRHHCFPRDRQSDRQLAPSVITGCIFDDPQYLYIPFVCSLAIEVGGTVWLKAGPRHVLKMILDAAISISARQNMQTSSFGSQSTNCHQDAQRVSVYWCAQSLTDDHKLNPVAHSTMPVSPFNQNFPV